MDEDAMRYYLIQDHRFIDDFVVLLASMVCCVRSSVRARVHERALVHASVCTLACPCAHAQHNNNNNSRVACMQTHKEH